jgi:CRP-like cAMP-binding protein
MSTKPDLPGDSEARVLEQSDLFRDLESDELERVYRAAYLKFLETNAYLFYQGDPASRLHVLAAGRLKIAQVTPEGQQIIVHYVSPGEAMAVVAVLSDMEFPASAQAVEDSQVLSWEKRTMCELMLHIPTLALNALTIVANHAREFQDRIRELSTERVERRIARALLRLVRQTGRKVPEGVLIDLPLSRQDLAEMAGTTLYTVSRTLSQWESQGLIKAGRERVVILYPHGLVSIAEDLINDKIPPDL